MADDSTTIELSRSELREVAGYAVACARQALAIFERERPDDRRPRASIDAAQAFADGGERTKALRDSAWAAHRAAQGPAMRDRLRRATLRARPAARWVRRSSTPCRTLLRSSTSSDRPLMPHERSNSAAETIPPSDSTRSRSPRILAPPVVVEVLRRYPSAPPGGRRFGELIRTLDASLQRQAVINRETT